MSEPQIMHPADVIKEAQESRLSAVAGELYTAYCAAVGGKSFKGDALPCWLELVADPGKETIVKAWLQTANRAIDLLS